MLGILKWVYKLGKAHENRRIELMLVKHLQRPSEGYLRDLGVPTFESVLEEDIEARNRRFKFEYEVQHKVREVINVLLAPAFEEGPARRSMSIELDKEL